MNGKQSKSPSGQGRVRALLVGAQDYCNTQIVPLSCARKDAMDMCGLLSDELGWPRSDITLLAGDSSDGPPTWSNIKQALRIEGPAMEPGDTFLFFFAGHGIEKNNETFLLPEDACLRPWGFEGRNVAVSVDDIEEVFRSPVVNRANRILWMDCCRRQVEAGVRAGEQPMGTSTRMVRDISLRFGAETEGVAAGGMAVFFACDQNQFANESKEAGNGLFCLSLLAALRRLAPRSQFIDHDLIKKNALEEIQRLQRQPEWKDLGLQIPYCETPGRTPFLPSFKAAVRNRPPPGGGAPRPPTATLAKKTRMVEMARLEGELFVCRDDPASMPMLHVPNGVYAIGGLPEFPNTMPAVFKESEGFFIDVHPVLLSDILDFARRGSFDSWISSRIPKRIGETHSSRQLVAMARGCGYRDIFAGYLDYFEARAYCESFRMRLPFEQELEIAMHHRGPKAAKSVPAIPVSCEHASLDHYLQSRGLQGIPQGAFTPKWCISPAGLSVREFTTTRYTDSYANEMQTDTWPIAVPALSDILVGSVTMVIRGGGSNVAFRQPKCPFDRDARVVFRRVLPERLARFTG